MSNKKKNQKSTAPMRILYPDTLVVLPTGMVTTIKAYYTSKERACPAVAYINPDETNHADIQAILNSPNGMAFFRERLQTTLDEGGPPFDSVMPAATLPHIAHYIESENNQTKKQCLQQICSIVESQLTAPKLVSAIQNHIIDGALAKEGQEIRDDQNTMNQMVNLLPPIYRTILPNMNLQILLCTDNTNIGIPSQLILGAYTPYTQIISMNLRQTEQSQQANLHEEFTHKIDYDLGFSLREGWRKALAEETDAAKEALKRFYIISKKDVFGAASGSGSFSYPKDKIPKELLADLFVIDHTDIMTAKEKADIKAAIPNMWAEYEEFLKQVKKYPEIMAEKRGETTDVTSGETSLPSTSHADRAGKRSIAPDSDDINNKSGRARGE